MRKRFPALVIVICVAAAPALAHHSFKAQFDGAKPVKLEGALTKQEWTDPRIWLDVKDASGSVVKWQCEGGAPNGMIRNGWTCNARSVTLPDGKRVLAGSSNHEGNKD